jgi:hypothetical protein
MERVSEESSGEEGSGESSDDDESEAEADDGADAALAGEDVYQVQDIVAKRRVRGVTEYQIFWKGYSRAANTWEPEEHVPAALIAEFNESRMGLAEQTDNDDSSDEENGGDDLPPAPPPAPPPRATGKRARGAEASSAAPAKRARQPVSRKRGRGRGRG